MRRSPTASSRPHRASASFTRSGWRPTVSTRCRPTSRRPKTRRPAPSWRRGIRSSSSARLGRSSSTRRSPAPLGIAPPPGIRRSRWPRTTRRPAASTTATGPSSSTTAAGSGPGSSLSGAVRPGVAVAPGIYWNKLVPGGSNVNSTTSSALTDMGGGATFFDNLVDVRRAEEPSG